MTTRRRLLWRAAGAWSLFALETTAARAQASEGRDILDKVEKLLWGSTVQGEYEMTIATPRWQRTLGLRLWMDRPRRSFVRIVSPAKEAGIGSLEGVPGYGSKSYISQSNLKICENPFRSA